MDAAWGRPTGIFVVWITVIHVVQPDTGICQVYSYNVQTIYSVESRGRLREKHLFVCCENKEPVCKGRTYQKTTSTHDFCHGDLPQDVRRGGHVSRNLVHWVQRESWSVLPGNGAIYCGDCCGQQMAERKCNQRAQEHSKHHACLNWVQCFMDECKKVYDTVEAHQDLGCELPPPPFPKHYHPDVKTIPPVHSTTPSTKTTEVPDECKESSCKRLSVIERCSKDCCAQHCCLPDGTIEDTDSRLPLNLSPGQLAGLALCIVLSLVVLTILVIFFTRKCRKRIKLTRVPQKDTQGLVIEEEDEDDDEQETEAVDVPT